MVQIKPVGGGRKGPEGFPLSYVSLLFCSQYRLHCRPWLWYMWDRNLLLIIHLLPSVTMYHSWLIIVYNSCLIVMALYTLAESSILVKTAGPKNLYSLPKPLSISSFIKNGYYSCSFIQLFIFSNCVILVRVVVDPERILGMHPEWDTSPSHTYSHTHLHKRQFILASPFAGMILGVTRKPEETHMDMGSVSKTPCKQ